ncbi:hypothetical protein [Botrimarina sp.]|uniref:hypothetical protein n=1 Tax=Botrimarina sp. TaxID=2795802 RepID=UPI0032ECBD85
MDELQDRPERAAYGLRVSAYDRSSSLLIAMLLLVGASVLAIVIVFFSSRIKTLPPAIPVTPVSAPSDDSGAAGGDVSEETPAVEDVPEVLQPELEELLEQVSLAVADEAVMMAQERAAEAQTAATAPGDSRGAGDGRGEGPGSREPIREIRFEPESMDEYARWFDEAGLEIGVLGTDNRVYYATALSTPSPRVRVGEPGGEGRLYFNSTGGPLHPLDRQLARKAGILDRGDLVLQFCTPETQQRLLTLERDAADSRPPSDIMRTVFRVVKRGGSFAFEVENQTYYR